MTAEPRLLDHELLDQLEGRWRRQGAPIADALRPGATPELAGGGFADYGLVVPEEIRTWWLWHDGADATGASPWARVIVGALWNFLSIDDARDELERRRALAAQVRPDDPEQHWRREWIPISTDAHGGCIVVDGTRDLEGPTAIYYTEPQMGARTNSRPAPSLGTLVQWWTEALDRGAGWNATDERWDYDDEVLDQDVLRTFLL